MVVMTVHIVSAYVEANEVNVRDLPNLIRLIYSALLETKTGASDGAGPSAPVPPAISVKRSLTPDYIVCLEDGKRFKSLKRHLQAHHSLTPLEYRTKWGLAKDYPMVAPNYTETRSKLARANGLGRKRRARRG